MFPEPHTRLPFFLFVFTSRIHSRVGTMSRVPLPSLVDSQQARSGDLFFFPDAKHPGGAQGEPLADATPSVFYKTDGRRSATIQALPSSIVILRPSANCTTHAVHSGLLVWPSTLETVFESAPRLLCRAQLIAAPLRRVRRTSTSTSFITGNYHFGLASHSRAHRRRFSWFSTTIRAEPDAPPR